MKDIESDEGGFKMAKLWKLKKSLCPYNKEPPVAMSDPCGNIITSEANLKKHTINHYISVPENRPMKDNLKDIKEDKEYLCKIRLELAKINKSKAWNIKDL